jgi:AraC-like DNA-binding protein
MMSYTQFNPHSALASYIDAYWMVTGHEAELKTEKILPDGCVDIIFNLGDDVETDNGRFLMKSEQAYLIGTMTRSKVTTRRPGTKLLGIRFKPAAFSAFYDFSSLHETTDQTIELEKTLSPDIGKMMRYSTNDFDRFFINKLSAPKHILFPVVADIQNQKGQLTVKTLAQRHFTTTRQLERSFKQHIGISPKEFISLTRYQFALQKIKNNPSGRSLADIAFEYGYYDHAHLTHELKKYTGDVPSLL